MTTLELDVGREGAERLVEAALRRTEGVDGFTREDDRFVVSFEGMTASFGQRLTVAFADAEDSTSLDVQAYRTSPFAFTANPWRRKADFLEELRRIRDDPQERSRIERGEVESPEERSPADDAEPEPVDPADLQTLRAIKLLLAVVGTVVLLVLGAAWVL